MRLRDAIKKDTFIIDSDEYTDSDLEAMSIDELETLKLRIRNCVDGLTTAIKAKQIEHETGIEPITSDWFVRHRIAQAINQQALSYVNKLIKRRTKVKRPFSEFFMDAAKAGLRPEEFESLMQKAKTEMNREGL